MAWPAWDHLRPEQRPASGEPGPPGRVHRPEGNGRQPINSLLSRGPALPRNPAASSQRGRGGGAEALCLPQAHLPPSPLAFTQDPQTPDGSPVSLSSRRPSEPACSRRAGLHFTDRKTEAPRALPGAHTREQAWGPAWQPEVASRTLSSRPQSGRLCCSRCSGCHRVRGAPPPSPRSGPALHTPRGARRGPGCPAGTQPLPTLPSRPRRALPEQTPLRGRTASHLSRQEWGKAARPLHMLAAGSSAGSTGCGQSESSPRTELGTGPGPPAADYKQALPHHRGDW